MTTTKDAPVTATIEQLATAAELAAITDPTERLTAAGEVAERAAALSDEHRYLRDAAALRLYELTGGEERKYGAGVVVWRDVIDVSKSRWRSILDEVDPEHVDWMRRKASQGQRMDARMRRIAERKAERAQVVHQLVTGLVAQLRDQGHDEPALRAIASEAAQRTKEYAAASRAAADVRNAAAVECMRMPGVSNAEVARLGKITTARAAQLRLAR
jgi:hypothetical protein